MKSDSFTPRLALLLLVPCLLMAATVTQTISFSERDLAFTRSGEYDVVMLRGGTALIDPGKPLVPQAACNILLPADARLLGFEAAVLDSVVLPGSFRLYPAQPYRPLSTTTPPSFVAPDPEAYAQAAYPGTPAADYSAGSKSGYRICSAVLYPVQYQPVTGRLVLYTRLRVTAEYAQGDERATSLTAAQRELFAKDIAALVTNPADVKRFAPVVRETDDNEIDYLVITGEGLQTALQPFCDWKTGKGIRTEMRTVPWITSRYPGRDVPEKIRNAVIDFYRNRGLKYLLLAGDVATVPCRRARARVNSENGDIPSDLYFADLDGSWDGDRDDIFGERSGDSVDLYSDIYVGRASIDNAAEANTFVEKVLGYEQSPDTSFIRKMLLPSGWLWESSGYHGSVVNNAIADLTPDGWFDARLENPVGGTVAAESIEAGYAYGHLAGHGNEQGVYSENGTPLYTTGSAGGQHNGMSKLGIINSMACHPGNFEWGECLAEVMMNNPNGGAVAVMMNSRYGWGTPPSMGPSEELDVGFYDFFFNYDSTDIGITHARGLDYFRAQVRADDCWRWCVYELNLLGDPQLPLWHDAPRTLSVLADASVRTGVDTLSVTVRSGGSPVRNALVCAVKGSEVYARGRTDANGQVALATCAATTGVVSLKVSSPGHYTYQDDITVTAGTPMAWLVGDGYTVDDAGSANENQRLEPGETDRVLVTLRNQGSLDASATTARLRSLNSYFTVVESIADYGTVAAGASKDGGAFQLMVHGDVPQNSMQDFELLVTSGEGTWTVPLWVYVGFAARSVADLDSCAGVLSVTAMGALGYDRQPRTMGRGFRCAKTDTSHLYLGSFVFGTGADYLLDNYYGQPSRTMDTDWRLRDSLRYVLPLWGSSQQLTGSYTDAGSPAARGLQIRQNSVVVNRPGYDKFAILVYDITNGGAEHMPQSYAGLLCDFDVVPTDKLHDYGRADAAARTVWMRNALTSNPTVGAYLLSGTPVSNASLIDPAVYCYPDSAMSRSMKFRMLNGAINRTVSDRAADWSVALAAGPIELCPGLTQRVAFALVSGTDSADFQANCDSAQSWYDQNAAIEDGSSPAAYQPTAGIQASPNPFTGRTRVSFQVRTSGRVRVSLYDAAGRRLGTLLDRQCRAGTGTTSWEPRGISRGAYFLKLETPGETALAKVLVL